MSSLMLQSVPPDEKVFKSERLHFWRLVVNVVMLNTYGIK